LDIRPVYDGQEIKRLRNIAVLSDLLTRFTNGTICKNIVPVLCTSFNDDDPYNN